MSGSADTSLLHGGGGKPSQNDILNSAILSNQLKGLDPKDPAYELIKQRQQEMLHPDNGGYLGSLSRVLTGTGQTTGENLAGFSLPLALNLYKNHLMNQAHAASNRNMANASATMLGQQRAVLGQGKFGS